MIHLMEVPNPDPTDLAARPAHGGRDRHACFGVDSVSALKIALSAANVSFTASASGRAALFFRDPDGNTLECAEHPPWRPAP
jgi:catechol 2,3-dioxygenase-like lactoylglutathione lyase family enzyme